MFTLLISTIVIFMGTHTSNNPMLTGIASGQYYEVIEVQYDPSVNTTYGIFVRYNIDDSNGKQLQHLQLRSLPGKATKTDLIKNAPHDAGITLIGE